MDVRPPDGIRGPRPTGPQKVSKRAETEIQKQPQQEADSVDISPLAKFVSEALSLPSVRQDVVERAKQAIASGKYESREILEKAVEKFIEQETRDILSEI